MDKQAIELNNGRAAQMGILGLMMHEAVNNHPYIINDLVRKGRCVRSVLLLQCISNQCFRSLSDPCSATGN